MPAPSAAWIKLVSASRDIMVPVGFAVTVPAQAVTGQLGWPALAGAVTLATALSVIARLLWRVGVRHYDGASS